MPAFLHTSEFRFLTLANYCSECGGCGKCFRWFCGYAFPLKACVWLCLIQKSPAVWWRYFHLDMILLFSSEGTCFLFDARRKWFSTSPIYLNIACIFVNLRISFLALEIYCTECGNCFRWFCGYAFPLKACTIYLNIACIFCKPQKQQQQQQHQQQQQQLEIYCTECGNCFKWY